MKASEVRISLAFFNHLLYDEEVRTTSKRGILMTQNIAALIDHTLLKQDATKEQIEKLCEEAKTYTFASVCVNPTWVNLSAKLLQDSPVKVCTVIGFPLRSNHFSSQMHLKQQMRLKMVQMKLIWY